MVPVAVTTAEHVIGFTDAATFRRVRVRWTKDCGEAGVERSKTTIPGHRTAVATCGNRRRNQVIKVGLLEVGQQGDKRAETTRTANGTVQVVIRVRFSGRNCVEGVVVVVDRNPQLLQIVAALRAAGGLASLLDGRQKQRHQNCDDGDDHQQFNEGKPSGANGQFFHCDLRKNK